MVVFCKRTDESGSMRKRIDSNWSDLRPSGDTGKVESAEKSTIAVGAWTAAMVWATSGGHIPDTEPYEEGTLAGNMSTNISFLLYHPAGSVLPGNFWPAWLFLPFLMFNFPHH